MPKLILVVGLPGDNNGATGVNGSLSSGSAFQSGAAVVFAPDATGAWPAMATGGE